MTAAIVFCGPSLPEEASHGFDGIEFRPPAARGDVLRAALQQPRCIGVVDGYFDTRPSVWHKEILWAMSQGIHVFGAASMGALRAAELADLGMRGVGRVFEAYRHGTVSADDEVAIVHAPVEHHYRPISEALVNIRFTLDAAVAEGVIGPETRVALVSRGRAQPYASRNYSDLLRSVTGTVDDVELNALRDWLPRGRIDQKACDARELCALVQRCVSERWPPVEPSYSFSHTDAWDGLYREVASEVRGERADLPLVSASEVVDELISSGDLPAVKTAALARLLCTREAQRSRIEPDPRAVESIAENFRRERGLITGEAFEAWLTEQRLDGEKLVPYFRREAIVHRVETLCESGLMPHIVDHLRSTGRFGRMVDRIGRKRDWLLQHGLSNPSFRDANLDEASLWRWYLNERVNVARAPDIALSFQVHRDRVVQALIREYVFASHEARDRTTSEFGETDYHPDPKARPGG